MHIDIYVIDEDGTHPIELKYKSKTIETVINGEYFYLKNHGAQDISRYDYLSDLSRIEKMKSLDKSFNGGYAIMLTNDPAYWKCPHRADTMDAAYRIHEGRIIHGPSSWNENVGAGTNKGRTEVIEIKGQYLLHWHEYSQIYGEKNGLFKACIVAVDK